MTKISIDKEFEKCAYATRYVNDRSVNRGFMITKSVVDFPHTGVQARGINK